ncbi:MAG TPA: DUF1010 domain-containing protein [Acidovorax defluvii]|nr:DUF1010 domain-containing protein [Acidovorax defluvii]
MLRRFTVFLASGAFTASASSYHFASIAPPQQHRLPTPAGWQRPNPHRPASPPPPPRPYHRPLFFWSFLHARSFRPAHFAGHCPHRPGASQAGHHRQRHGV